MIVLYSTNCPKCKVLESKLNDKGFKYGIVTDVNVMQEKGFEYAPVLDVNGTIYDFSGAIKWLGEIKDEIEETNFVCASCEVK